MFRGSAACLHDSCSPEALRAMGAALRHGALHAPRRAAVTGTVRMDRALSVSYNQFLEQGLGS